MKTLKFTRDELDWIYRYVEAGAQTMESLVGAYHPGPGPVWEKSKSVKQIEVHDPLVQAQLDHARANGPARRDLADQLKGLLDRGVHERIALENTRKELEEIIEHGDERANALGKEQLEKLQREEDYEIKGDMSLFRLMFEAVDKYMDHMEKQILPGYHTKPDAHFPDPMRPRMFYQNKSKKMLAFLKELRNKLEVLISSV
ncbi:MAG: hypothetical protein NVS9B9_08590 [Ktedonobacteraceae bacterium]